MRSKKLVALVFVMNWLLIHPKAQPVYQPKHGQDWQTVKKRISESWHLSKVDPAVSRSGLTLPLPYYSIRPGRNVLFNWDTYFTNAGLLLIDSLAGYAKNAVENQFAEIEQVGFVPNASERWALNRSQTPFLSMMVREVYEKIHPGKEWLQKAYDHLYKEYLFWTRGAIEDHNTLIKGLQRFYHHATKEELLTFYAQIAPRFGFPDSLPGAEKLKMGEAWMAEAETGMDFTPRFENRCHQFIAVDLNSNLYIYEKNFAWMVKELALPNKPDWDKIADTRKALLTKYCWNEKEGMFMDYDFVNKCFSKIRSVATFYPLWAGLATKEQAGKVVKKLHLFEFEYGPTVCERSVHKHIYQWDYPAGWPPVYYLVVRGLHNYGYYKDAKRIAGKYLDLVTKNFNHPTPVAKREPMYVYEKYNVTDGTIYDAEYPSRTFHGWSYGVFVWCLHYYSKQ